MNLSVSSSATTAYLLVIHGSHDPRPMAAAQQIAIQISHQLSKQDYPLPLVKVACLELAPIPLHQQIVAFGDRALQSGYTTLAIIPLFLLPGVHVCEDIPEEVAIAQTMLKNQPAIQLHSHLGQATGMVDSLVQQKMTMAQAIPTATILMAHGSRRPGGHQPIETIATQLDAVPAYWAVSPSLDDQIHHLAQREIQHIIVLPYFLFDGGITDAIAQKLGEMGDRYPHLTMDLGQPVGTTTDIVPLLLHHLRLDTPSNHNVTNSSTGHF